MAKPRSVVGRPLDELPDVVAPLQAAIGSIDPSTLSTPIQKFIRFQMIDAYRTCAAVMSLVDARKAGADIDAYSVEVLTRRVVEQAIVVTFAVTDPVGVERFARTNEHEYEKSFGHAPRERVDSEAKQLPKYSQMAEKADPELGKIYSKLSHLSHPRASMPYSAIEEHFAQGTISGSQFFEIRVMPLVDDLDVAVEHVLAAWVSVKP